LKNGRFALSSRWWGERDLTQGLWRSSDGLVVGSLSKQAALSQDETVLAAPDLVMVWSCTRGAEVVKVHRNFSGARVNFMWKYET